MNQFLGLLGDGADKGGVGVADGDSGNPRNPILIPVAFVVEKILHLAFDHEEGLLVVMEVKVRDVGFTISKDLLVRGAVVDCRFVITGGELHRESRSCEDSANHEYI